MIRPEKLSLAWLNTSVLSPSVTTPLPLKLRRVTLFMLSGTPHSGLKLPCSVMSNQPLFSSDAERARLPGPVRYNTAPLFTRVTPV
ncbi:hypothetical protein D3C80_1688240 [compost metagenome]